MHRSCCRQHREASCNPRQYGEGGIANALAATLGAEMEEGGLMDVEFGDAFEVLPSPPAGGAPAISATGDEELSWDLSAGVPESVVGRSMFDQRIREHETNPYFSRERISEPVCPYCSRRFNCLLVDTNEKDSKEDTARPLKTDFASKEYDRDVLAQDGAIRIDCRWLSKLSIDLKLGLSLPPIFLSVTYRHTLGRLLLANSIALQKSPEFVFSPQWTDLSELGSIVASKQ